MKQKEKHAIVLFISTEKAAEDEERQTLLREFASSCDVTIVGFFAMAKNNIHVGIQHAVDQCVSTCASYIIFDQPSSFALTPSELMVVMDRLLVNGLTLAFAENRSVFGVLELLTLRDIVCGSNDAAQKNRSKNIKRALKLKKRRGHRLGGKKFGSCVDEETIISQIIKFHKDGLSLQKICDALESNNVKTIHNKTWHPTTIKRIIERRK